MAEENLLQNEDIVNDFQKEKDALIARSKGNIDEAIERYKQMMNNYLEKENDAASKSYEMYQATSGTGKQNARSAYLNRKGEGENSVLAGNFNMDNNKKIYNSYLDRDDMNFNENVNNLGYKNYINSENLKYQEERDAVEDSKWKKEYDLSKAIAKRKNSGWGRYGNYWNRGYFIDPLKLLKNASNNVQISSDYVKAGLDNMINKPPVMYDKK